MPDGIKNWQENRRRLGAFKQLVDSTGLERLSYHYNVSDSARMDSLRKAERKYNKTFVALPKNVNQQTAVFVTPRYLQGLLNYSLAYEQQLRQIVDQIINAEQQNNYLTAARCAIDNTIMENFELVEPACLSLTAYRRLNSVMKGMDKLKKQ